MARYRAAPQFYNLPDTPHVERVGVRDFIAEGTTTVAPSRKPDGWRGDRHGPWTE